MTKKSIANLMTRKGRCQDGNNMIDNSARKKPILKIQAIGGLIGEDEGVLSHFMTINFHIQL